MLQRAASNAYSWWWASHIRTKQTKWLDTNLQEMEDTVKRMLKLIEPDADSFARRAELYFKRRPELITFVEDVYRAYRALAERYDHISGELHKANHTIATACPDQVQYAMLEEEDGSLPKAITPIDPDKINKPIVEGLMKKKRESESSAKKEEKESNAPLINKKEAEEEINKLQKEILVLQTEKEYIKSSYESGIAKYWEIEKQVMEKQEKVYYLQDEFSTSAVIEDNEARFLMTTAALKSCEDAIVNLQEQRKKSLEQAKVESERAKIANEKLNSLKGEHSGMENAEVSGENKQMSFTAEKMAEGANSLNKARLEIQSICEKVKTHFEMNPESSVIEVAEKINGLVNKVITLELTVSSQATHINQLTSDNNELDKSLRELEEEKNILINDSNALTKKLREAEEELRRVQAVLKLIQDEEIIFQENFTEACHILNDISEKLQPHQPLENYLPADAFAEADASSFNVQPQSVSQIKEVTEIHDSKEDFGEEFHTTQECLDDPSMSKVASEPKCASENIEDSKKITEMGEKGSSEAGLEGEENILLAEYRSILQNYEETKRRLSETEKKNEEYLEGTMATITELKNAIAMKDEEIELLRQQLASRKTSSDGTVDMPSVEDTWVGHQKPESTSNSVIVTGNSKPLDSDKPKDLNVSTTKRKSYIEFPELQSSPEEGANLDSLNELRSISPIEEKFRREIDTLLDGNLEFWLRFSTSFHHILEFKSKYNDLQAEISKLRDNNAAESNATSDQAGAPESASISKRLRELRTELQVWLEQCELLGAELQSRISSLCELQEEISSAINSKSESAEILFTPFQAAKLHGEVMNMKQENIKAANELQVGLDQVRRLQPDIEKQLPKLYDNFKPSQSESSCPSPNSENSSGTTSIPLRVFLFGAKPKKRSFFERIQPVFQKQNAKLRASRWSKRHPQPKE